MVLSCRLRALPCGMADCCATGCVSKIQTVMFILSQRSPEENPVQGSLTEWKEKYGKDEEI